MSFFLKVPHLTAKICSIIEEAKGELFIVSPFIVLHDHYKMALQKQIDSNVHVTILFGKYTRSGDYVLSDDDLEFLKLFKNIDVYYNSKLHAKYYGNESEFITTSLNLNFTSHNNNYEYGVLYSLIDSNSENDKMLGNDLMEYINYIINDSISIFSNSNKAFNNNEKINSIREEYPNAYNKWTLEDDEKLEQLYCKNVVDTELAILFGRQPSAIRSRIGKLELAEKYPL